MTGDLSASNPPTRDSGSRVARDAWGAAAEWVCIIRLPTILQDSGRPWHIPQTGHRRGTSDATSESYQSVLRLIRRPNTKPVAKRNKAEAVSYQLPPRCFILTC